ncbi:MAG: hypothetical protein WBQ44_14600 [Rhodococcus sp. (in: high G+C Gram-positive bacteria)]
MREHRWAAAALRARGVPVAIVGDADPAAASAVRSASRLAAAVHPSDQLPLILATTVPGTTGGTE